MSRTAAQDLDAELEAYWSAVSEGDERGAQAVATGVLRAGVPVEAVLRGLVVAAQARVGQLWAANTWTVPQEHAATAIGESVVRLLAREIPEPPDGPALVLACVEREWHALPALVVAQTLRARGLRVDYLGASASRDHLISRIVDLGPRAVLLSASLTSSLPRARRHIEAIRGTSTPVVVGGQAFDAEGVRARRVGATAYAADPAALLDLLPTLPRHVAPAPPLRHPAASEARSLQGTFESVARDVVTATRTALGLGDAVPGHAPDHWTSVLTGHVPHVVDCLIGSLLIEDPTVMRETQGWLADVLGGRDSDAEAVPALWDALRQRLHDYPEALLMLDA